MTPIRYPASLPVSERKDEILATIRDHQVVVVAGETGSGKSTQLPKICLELGRGSEGRLIGHTQPRRIAARTLAERIASELDTDLGRLVGYTVRFTDKVSADTRVRLMTDGILLAELQRDRDLKRYDTLIIDEAHERSLNIDFILGYLKRLLPRRPDLKVIITSATIDTARFSEHFDGAPIVEVTGRTYPVEIRYRPLTLVVDGDDGEDGTPSASEAAVDERDQVQAIVDAIDELRDEGPGDVLVFLSGEREIRDAADALHEAVQGNRRFTGTEILPLYARLSAAEQHRVFQPHPGRRIVLATNVAETSLTVPGIRYVVDAGTARVSRFNRRTKVQRLPIEPVSQAAANQRAGRCGRVAPGICIRLYSEDDFERRPAFTEPEILRTNLASVILQMATIGLGNIASFPFVEPPDARSIKDGVDLLEELGAFGDDGRVTKLGRQLARLPLDPRLARMVIEAGRHGCVREVMVIAAAISIQDPRERPVEHREAADQFHRRFVEDDGDFMALVRLWDHLRERQKALSSNQFRKLCKAEYVNYLRVREWQDIFSQLRQMTQPLGLHLNRDLSDADSVHRSVLAGLLSHIGLRDDERREYLGARNARFALNPGSSLFRRPPRWVMAAELVETTRLWGRVAARIEPEWVEPLADHLVKRSYTEPEWDVERGAAVANERVTLYGIPLVTSRRVSYARIDPGVSRELFIRHALVAGEWRDPPRFWAENQALLDEVAHLEDRVRRSDLLVTDDELFAFYDERVGHDVVSSRSFNGWWRKARDRQPDLLRFTYADVIDRSGGPVRVADYPDEWSPTAAAGSTGSGVLRFGVSYVFDPGASDDGAAVHVPLAMLNRLGTTSPAGLDWQLPGLRPELVTALVRGLPKHVRRGLPPAPQAAAAFLASRGPVDGDLVPVLAHWVTAQTGETIYEGDLDLDVLPPHLRLHVVVEDEDGKTIAVADDPAELMAGLRDRLRAAVADAAAAARRPGSTTWTFGTIARTIESGPSVAYPTLVDSGASVSVEVVETAAEQRRSMWAGTRRLLLLAAPGAMAAVERRLTNPERLALAHGPYEQVRDLVAECVETATDELLAAAGGPVWDEPAWERLRGEVTGEVHDRAFAIARRVAGVLTLVRHLDGRVATLTAPARAAAREDLRAQIAGYVFPGFVASFGSQRLDDIARYLQAADHRLDRLPGDAARDATRTAIIQRLQSEYEATLAALPASQRYTPDALAIRWSIEELRISLFAQALGTARKVSEERIRRDLRALLS